MDLENLKTFLTLSKLKNFTQTVKHISGTWFAHAVL